MKLDMSESTHFPAESSASGPAAEVAPHLVSNDETGSYLQVVVEKHRHKRNPTAHAAAAQTSPRLPAASSPLTYNQGGRGDGAGERGVFVLPPPVLLTCPAGESLCPALQAHAYFTRRTAEAAGGGGAPGCAAAGEAATRTAQPAPPAQRPKKNKAWQLFQDFGTNKLCDGEPDRVEVYYFEHGTGEFLATCEGGRPTCVERAARRGARLASAMLAEFLAAPQLLLALPVALLLHVQRCLLVAVRGASTGLVQTASDYALKPALALTFNALVQPVLVFCTHVARGIRAALRPLALALGDALEPVTRLLAAVRLVDVHVECAHRTAQV